MRSPLTHLVFWSLVCIASLASYSYGYAVLAKTSAAVAELQAQIDAKTESANRIASARLILSEIAADEAVVRGYFVPEAGVVSFIDNLEARAAAQKAAMRVLSVATGSVGEQPTLVLSLALDGTFDAVMRTIGAIEYAPYNLYLSSLSLSENGKGIWHAEFGITVGSVSANATSTSKTSSDFFQHTSYAL